MIVTARKVAPRSGAHDAAVDALVLGLQNRIPNGHWQQTRAAVGPGALGAISERSYQQAFRRLSREGWRRNEPVDLGPPEEPQLLARAFALLERKGLAAEDVLRDFALPESLVRVAGGSAPGLESKGTVVPLRPRLADNPARINSA